MGELEEAHLVSRSKWVDSFDSFNKQLLTQYGWQDKQTTKWETHTMRTSLQKNLAPLPRTIHEANRDATYACAIQTFKSDTKLALDFLGDAILGFIWVGIVLGSAIGAVYFVFVG